MREFVELAREALAQARRIQVVLRESRALIEVHAVGLAPCGNPAVYGWQVSESGVMAADGAGWKLLPLTDAVECCLGTERSLAPRLGYRPEATGLAEVWFQY